MAVLINVKMDNACVLLSNNLQSVGVVRVSNCCARCTDLQFDSVEMYAFASHTRQHHISVQCQSNYAYKHSRTKTLTQ
jgi:hypothetical protein